MALAGAAFVFWLGLDFPLPAFVSRWTGVTRVQLKPIGQELVPSEDQNRFIVNVICPVGSSIDYVDEMLKRGEDIIIGLKDQVTGKEVAASVFAAVSIRPGALISEGINFVRLIPRHERAWSQADIMNEVRAAFAGSAYAPVVGVTGDQVEVRERSGATIAREITAQTRIMIDGKESSHADLRPGMRVRFLPTKPEHGELFLVEAKFTQSDAIPGVRVVVLDLSTQGFTATRGYPVNFAIQGPDWPMVTRFSERIRERLLDSGAVADVNSDYRPGMPEVRIVPDKQKAAQLGVSMQRLAMVLNISIGGVRGGRFTDNDRRYDVRLRYLEAQRDAAEDIPEVFVKSDKGKLVPIRDLTRVETVSTLPVITRYNHHRKVEISANMAPGVPQGEAIARSYAIVDQVRAEMGLPPSYRIVPLGNAQAMKETIDSLWWALALGFVVAYMILGVQFNSFVHPFTVLMAVPFGVTGALATLYVAGDTLNLMSMIGMVLLAGLVKKNSIILVDYINQIRARGVPVKEAVIAACPVRLRPIIMTSLATVAAAAPLAFGIGPGAETRAPLARSIIGGIVLSTLITLAVVPALYVVFDSMSAWTRNLTKRPHSLDESSRSVRVPAPHEFEPIGLGNGHSKPREAVGSAPMPSDSIAR
jgi:multidrug efflux pump subunit AcrB